MRYSTSHVKQRTWEHSHHHRMHSSQATAIWIRNSILLSRHLTFELSSMLPCSSTISVSVFSTSASIASISSAVPGCSWSFWHISVHRLRIAVLWASQSVAIFSWRAIWRRIAFSPRNSLARVVSTRINRKVTSDSDLAFTDCATYGPVCRRVWEPLEVKHWYKGKAFILILNSCAVFQEIQEVFH